MENILKRFRIRLYNYQNGLYRINFRIKYFIIKNKLI